MCDKCLRCPEGRAVAIERNKAASLVLKLSGERRVDMRLKIAAKQRYDKLKAEAEKIHALVVAGQLVLEPEIIDNRGRALAWARDNINLYTVPELVVEMKTRFSLTAREVGLTMLELERINKVPTSDEVRRAMIRLTEEMQIDLTSRKLAKLAMGEFDLWKDTEDFDEEPLDWVMEIAIDVADELGME